MPNIDSTVKTLNDVVLGIIDIDMSRHAPKHVSLSGLLDVRVNISIFGFDDLLHEGSRRTIYPRLDKPEPSIDIIEDKETIKLIAHFPGLKKEDVIFEIKDGVIELEVKMNGVIKHKSIPCDVKPNKVLATSTTYNNSVLEIIFKKI